jgi:hypothetical protein
MSTAADLTQNPPTSDVPAVPAQCAFQRKNNTRCRARSHAGSDYCTWHQPDAAPAPSSSAHPFLPGEVELETAEDVYQLMKTAAIHLAIADQPDTGRFHALNALAGTLLRSVSVKELQADVAELTRKVQSSRQYAEEVKRERDHARAWGEDVAKDRNEIRTELKKCRNKLLSLGIDPNGLEDT